MNEKKGLVGFGIIFLGIASGYVFSFVVATVIMCVCVDSVFAIILLDHLRVERNPNRTDKESSELNKWRIKLLMYGIGLIVLNGIFLSRCFRK